MKWHHFNNYQPLVGTYILVYDGSIFELGYFNYHRHIILIESDICFCPECGFIYKGADMIWWTPVIEPKKKFRNVTASLKLKVLKRDRFKCVSCRLSPSIDPSIELQIDHIYPYSKGGSDDINNLQVLCKNCNTKKGNKYVRV